MTSNFEFVDLSRTVLSLLMHEEQHPESFQIFDAVVETHTVPSLETNLQVQLLIMVPCSSFKMGRDEKGIAKDEGGGHNIISRVPT